MLLKAEVEVPADVPLMNTEIAATDDTSRRLSETVTTTLREQLQTDEMADAIEYTAALGTNPLSVVQESLENRDSDRRAVAADIADLQSGDVSVSMLQLKDDVTVGAAVYAAGTYDMFGTQPAEVLTKWATYGPSMLRSSAIHCFERAVLTGDIDVLRRDYSDIETPAEAAGEVEESLLDWL